MSTNLNRRSVIKGILAGTAVMGFPSSFSAFANTKEEETMPTGFLKGKLNHSVARWCFNDFDIETLCIEVKKMGITGIDLVGPKDWPTLKKHNLVSTMCNGAELNLVDGFNDLQFHEALIKNYIAMIPLVAEAGYKNLICFSGSRRGKTDEEGWQNCVIGLQKLIPLAEKHNVTLVMELLNSKIDHMQIDEGDVIRNITDNHQYIAHFHTAGVPGRHEIDETQELNYVAIMKAIAATNYKGFIGQEFIPKNANKLESLRKAILICDI